VDKQDRFIESTPIGDIQFTNLIASFDPSAPTKLVLAAHFDSKHFDEYPANQVSSLLLVSRTGRPTLDLIQFIGATDSAAPCSTLLDLAESLTPLLRLKERQIREGTYGGDEEWAYTGLEMVFFDGEEAFRDWTGRDSIYGARSVPLFFLFVECFELIRRCGWTYRGQTPGGGMGANVSPRFSRVSYLFPLHPTVRPHPDDSIDDRASDPAGPVGLP
jgi:hypothetical protein